MTAIIIIAIIFSVLMFPLNVHITKLEKPVVVFSWFFIRKQLYPIIGKEKKEKKLKTKKKSKKKTETVKPKKKLTLVKIKEYTELASDISSKLFPPVKKLIKRTEVKNLDLVVNVASEDAFNTAINFAKINVAVYGIVNILDSVFTLTVKRVVINPDFIAEKTSYKCDVWIKLRPLFLIIGGFNIGFIAICQAVKFSSSEKAEKNKQAPKKKRFRK